MSDPDRPILVTATCAIGLALIAGAALVWVALSDEAPAPAPPLRPTATPAASARAALPAHAR